VDASRVPPTNRPYRHALGAALTVAVFSALVVVSSTGYSALAIPPHPAQPVGANAAGSASPHDSTDPFQHEGLGDPAGPDVERWIPTSVTSTFDPYNGSVLPGEFNPPSPGYAQAALAIPSPDVFVVGDQAGNHVYVLNATTGAELRAINFGPPSIVLAGSDPDTFAYNNRTGVLYVGLLGDSAVDFVNLSSGHILREVTGFDGPTQVVYDSENGILFVGNWTGVVALNGSTGSLVSNIPLEAGGGIQWLALDLQNHTLLASDGVGVYVVNLTAFHKSSHFVVPDGSGAMLYDPDSGKVYVAGNGNVSVIDAGTDRLNVSAGTIDLGGYLYNLALDTGGHEVFASDCQQFGYRTCAFYDTNDTELNYTLPGAAPAYVAFDAATNHLLVYNNNDTVYLFNGTDNREVAYVPMITSYLGGTLDPTNGLEYIATPALGGFCDVPGQVTVLEPSAAPGRVALLPAGDGPSEVAYDPVDQRVFVTNFCSNSVTVINATNDSVDRLNLPVGLEPYGIAYDPSNDTVWVANENSQNLTVLNGSTLATVATVALPQGYPYALAFDPANDTVFVSNIYGRSVTSLSASSYAVTDAGIPVGDNPQGLLYDAQNGLVYVANGGSDNLSLVNATSLTDVGSIPTVAGTSDLAVDAADHLVFATDTAGSRLEVIDTFTNTAESPTLPASENPEAVVYDPATHQADVTNFGTGAINIVADAPVISNLTPVPEEGEVDHPFTLTVSVNSGTSPYGYAYRNLPPGCVSEDVAELECEPTSAGQSNVTVEVTDSLGYNATATIEVTVVPPPTSEGLHVDPSAVDLGGNVSIQWGINGGVPPLTYVYSGLPSGCDSVNRSVLNCTPEATGFFVVQGTVTDGVGGTTTAAASLVVNPAPRVTSFVAIPALVPVNTTFVLAAQVTGGTGDLNFSYIGLPPGCVSENSSALRCVPILPANYTVTLTVVDALGVRATASTEVSVLAPVPPVPPPPPRILAFLADPSNTTLGTEVTFFVVLTGGEVPVTVQLSDLPPGCVQASTNATSLTCRPSTTGSFEVLVVVTDQLGRSADAETNLTVEPAPIVPSPVTGVSTGPSLVETALVAGAMGAIAGVGVVAGWALWRRRSDHVRTPTTE
jgi:YVTN family beta-propeller protein